MAARGPRPWLLLPLVLLVASLAQPSAGESPRQFSNRHIDFPRSGPPADQGYCNRLMLRRGLTRPTCLPSNVFIHAPAARVHAVCRGAGKRLFGKVYASLASFQLTKCQLTSGIPGRCAYRTSVLQSRIRVTCS